MFIQNLYVKLFELQIPVIYYLAYYLYCSEMGAFGIFLISFHLFRSFSDQTIVQGNRSFNKIVRSIKSLVQ